MEQVLRPLGFRCERFTYRDVNGVEKVNLIAKLGSDADIGLALIGHTDCVPADGWEKAFKLLRKHGRLYGRGSCDTKAFIACMLETAELAARTGRPIQLIFTADEEKGEMGIARMLAALPHLFIAPKVSLSPGTRSRPPPR